MGYEKDCRFVTDVWDGEYLARHAIASLCDNAASDENEGLVVGDVVASNELVWELAVGVWGHTNVDVVER